MTDDLPAIITRHAERSPAMPASMALGVKQYDELCRRIICTPVTPLRVVVERLRELTEEPHAD